MQTSFKGFDKDNSGHIEGKEIKEVIHSLGLSEVVSE